MNTLRALALAVVLTVALVAVMLTAGAPYMSP